MKEAEQAGLIHKAFYPGSRETSTETSICNCSKDYCNTLDLWQAGTPPLINSTYHLSMIDAETCTVCGICLEWCSADAIVINKARLAMRDESACFGSGFAPGSAPKRPSH